MKIIFSLTLMMLLSLWSCRSDKGKKEGSAAKDRVSEPARIYTEPQAKEEAGNILTTGKKIYEINCLACHQAGGQGVPGMFPPLNKNEYTSDKTKLIGTVIHGLEGPITVNGQEFNNIMPAQDYLSDEDIATALTYILQTFVGSEEKVTPEEVAAVRAKK